MPPREKEVHKTVLLVTRAQSGDRAALDQLLRGIQDPLYRHVLGIIRDADLSRDVLQDVLFTVCRKLSWVRDPRWFRAWTYRIATREAVRRARRERLRPDLPAGSDVLGVIEQAAPEEPPDEDILARLPDLLESLSPASAIVLRMHYLDGLTHAEIAEALEIAIGTVKSRLAYGLASLRRSKTLERAR